MPEFPEVPIKRLCISGLYFSFIILALIISTASYAQAESTVYGHVYDWSTFDAINYSIVEVNTVPGQKIVTTDGSYSLIIPGGNYTISATSGYGSRALYGYENISVRDDGEYKIDLLLFPDNNISALEAFDQNLPATATASPVDNGNLIPPGTVMDYLPAIVAATTIAAMAIIAFVLIRQRAPAPDSKPNTAVMQESFPSPKAGHDTADEPPELAPQETCEPPKQEQAASAAGQLCGRIVPEKILRPDCKSIIAVIEKKGGRITQLDLRKALPYSEAKISLIISELEDAGYLKKIKRGRGNVLILTYHEDESNCERPGE